tara:strand:- start:440 stop:685 length:246 start_codon:yes stop_codon:yes gene_type:complete
MIADIDDSILDNVHFDELPYHMISGSGDAWFLDPDLKTMVLIKRGTEVIPVEKLDDKKSLVRSSFNFLVVPDDELIEIGFN